MASSNLAHQCYLTEDNRNVSVYGERLKIESSVIHRFNYSPHTKMLQVDFKTGETYVYLNVPKSIYLKLEAHGSKGTAFNTYIKKRYKYFELTVKTRVPKKKTKRK